MGHLAEVGTGCDEGQLQILRRPPRRTPQDDRRICRWRRADRQYGHQLQHRSNANERTGLLKCVHLI